MIPRHAHDYLSVLRFDPAAERRVCWLPLSSIYWSDEIPDQAALRRIPEEDRMAIYRLFAIRLHLWRKEPLGVEDEGFWRHCEQAYPQCPILRRKALSPEDQEVQDQCEAGADELFQALCSDADDVDIKTDERGIQSFNITFDCTEDH